MLSLLLPRRCVHCDRPSITSRVRSDYPLADYLCEVCSRILESDEPPNAQSLQQQFLRVSDFDVQTLVTVFTFIPESPVQSLIHSLKYSGMVRLARRLGAFASELAPAEVDCIVPVPLHRTRHATRGYNQAEAIADGLAKLRHVEVIRATKRTRPTPTQTKLSLPERVENMRDAFALTRHAHHIAGKNILIVDDVMTTGATLASVAGTLVTANPKSISILALAAVTA
ncbi:MAG: ComF family protein [Bacteroidota bacterium]|nr:ComF family protein [Bacteroidota bacterium]MDP4232367.1 ComF family protein [Bacteroidota bacterium]MDP4241504.1 ComF family protein [Bacteroidota bacterium]MDP4288998.1 ComF family protein [Bacteroidota bacterium]